MQQRMAATVTTTNGDYVIAHSSYVLIVGGGSKGATYLSQCIEKYSNDIECIHLRTKECLKLGYKTYSKRFKQLKLNIIAICPLTDSLICFCDSMCKIWNLPHNDPKTSEIRRNKALMHQTLSESHKNNKIDKVKKYFQSIIHNKDENKNENKNENNVRYGKLFEINNYLTSKKEFEDKMKENDLNYPIVIKPPTSGGTDGVRLCYTFEAAQKVVKKYLFQENSEKNTNISMMCQEFLDGEEYVVNSVSFNSVHKITDIWRARKTFLLDRAINVGLLNGDDDEKKAALDEDDDKLYPYSMLYDYQQFVVDLNNFKMELIVNYVCLILDVLGVKYGCGHTEIIYLPSENRVCLVELNARCGGGIPRAKQLVGYDQYQILALCCVDSSRFLKEIPNIYSKNVNINVYGNSGDDDDKSEDNEVTVRVIFLQSHINGKMDFVRLDRLETELSTFDKWARELIYIDFELWMKYKLKLMLTQQKLRIVVNAENEKYAQMDFGAGYSFINNEEMDFLEEQKDECRQAINYLKETIGRIEKIKKTVDLVSSPGAIVLMGKLSDIVKDFYVVRQLEKAEENGIFIDGKVSNSDQAGKQMLQQSNDINITSFMLSVYELMEDGLTVNEAQMAVQQSINDK